jgi:hypothetical protein
MMLGLAFAYLWLFNIDIDAVLLPLSTFILSATFIFGNQLRNLFEVNKTMIDVS